jgi:putative membrane protein
MQMVRTLMSMVIVVALAVPAAGWAQQPPAKPAEPGATKAPADKGMPSGDRKFVVTAAQGGLAEVELGTLAAQRASTDAVKQFGQRMASDHGKANEELKGLAQQKGVPVPTALDAKHKKLHDRLSKLSGAEFDRAYMDEMVKDHRKDVSEFRSEAERGKDPDVKAWAAKTLPTLEAHLKQAETVNAQVKGTGRAAK